MLTCCRQPITSMKCLLQKALVYWQMSGMSGKFANIERITICDFCLGVSGMHHEPRSMPYSGATSWHKLAYKIPCCAAPPQAQPPQLAAQSAHWGQPQSHLSVHCRPTAACLHLQLFLLCVKIDDMLLPAGWTHTSSKESVFDLSQ